MIAIIKIKVKIIRTKEKIFTIISGIISITSWAAR